MALFGIFEFVGTIAFAISGALVGVKKRLDFFGVMVLALTTAIGGGIIRDIIIGNTPPLAFLHPKYCIIALSAAIGVWFFHGRLFKLTNVILIFDAIGLGAFTVNGAKIALQSDEPSLFIALSLGVLTGVGGGVLRDLLTLQIPLIFRKEIYATASISGVIAFFYSRLAVEGSAPLYIGFAVTLLIRLVSLNFNLHLPVPKHDKEPNNKAARI